MSILINALSLSSLLNNPNYFVNTSRFELNLVAMLIIYDMLIILLNFVYLIVINIL